MKNAVILDYQSLAPADLDLSSLWGLAGIHWQTFDSTPVDKTAQRIADVSIVLTNKVVLDANLLAKNPQLKLIIILATGTNNVDLQAAETLGIQVCNIVAYSAESVVQHTFASILALQSHLLDYDHAVKNGDWCKSPFFGLLNFPIAEIAGKTLGIIGYGTIGKRVKQVAEAFNMQVLVCKSIVPDAEKDDSRTAINELYRQADILSIHSPLSPYSENLIDDAAFALMKPSSILINVGRGGIVNEQALVKALKAGQIKAAATDVLTTEPPSEDHILLDKSIPNLIITPHTAWASQEARQALLIQVGQILTAFLNSKPLPNTVTGNVT
ncbi:MAG: D-2-hydroxyacid dehydrogenase [Pseudomonadales bacterium]|nr:D-2-hydroxyacid dehydrogenase [Pseudomonadales bacterium]